MEKFLKMVDQTSEVSNTQQINEDFFKEFLSKYPVCFITYQAKNILLSQIQRKNLSLLIITMTWTRVRV